MIFETYHKFENLYKLEHEKAKVRLSAKSAEQVRTDYEILKKDLIEYRDSKGKNKFSNFSLIEQLCLYIFFWRYHKDLNKLKDVEVLDTDTTLNIISGLFGYKALLDNLIETNDLRSIEKEI